MKRDYKGMLLAFAMPLSLQADESLRDSILAGLAAQPQKHFSFVQEKNWQCLKSLR